MISIGTSFYLIIVFEISVSPDAGTPTAVTKSKLETAAAGGSLSSNPATLASLKVTHFVCLLSPSITYSLGCQKT